MRKTVASFNTRTEVITVGNRDTLNLVAPKQT